MIYYSGGQQGIAAASFDWQIGCEQHDQSKKSIWPDGVIAQPGSTTA